LFELHTQPDISPLEIKTTQLAQQLNHRAQIPPPTEAARYLIEVPYIGFIGRKGRGKSTSLVLAEREPSQQAEKIAALRKTLETTLQRGYTASTIFGLRGEGSAASAFSGVLCLMPCHWAAYAATAAKILPILGYAALQNEPSCCNPQTTGQHLFSLAVDTVFYSTLGLLTLGAGRRVLRRSQTKAATATLQHNDETRIVLDDSVTTTTPSFYSAIEKAGTQTGLPEMISERTNTEYVRPHSGAFGKLITPIHRGFRKTALSLADKNYKKLSREISRAYAELAHLTHDLSHEAATEEQGILTNISRHYAAAASHALSSFSTTGLAKKTLHFIKGFAHNECVYRVS
jgi:hypothetical protein